MKRLVLAAVAASMLAMPLAQAQAAPQYGQQQYGQSAPQWKKKPPVRKAAPAPVYKKYHPPVHKQYHPRWKQGQKMYNWRAYHSVRDYHRYGLRRPAPGQEWIRVGNDYLLVGIVSGVIAGIIAAH